MINACGGSNDTDDENMMMMGENMMGSESAILVTTLKIKRVTEHSWLQIQPLQVIRPKDPMTDPDQSFLLSNKLGATAVYVA